MPKQISAKKNSPTMTPKATYHHGDLRAQLISSARELVEAHGPDGFSVSEAARHAGVSSAAPYKHFKDRHEILRGVTSEALDRLRISMEGSAATHCQGSVEAIAAVGLAYVEFAKTEPGVFRLVFGLTDGHENAPDLLAKGENCFGVVVQTVAARCGRPPDDPDVLRCAYMLWSFVHGHSFLSIDKKQKVASAEVDDWDYMMSISSAILASLAL